MDQQNHLTQPSDTAQKNLEEKAAKELLEVAAKTADTIIISPSNDGTPVIHHTKNLYPIVRHVILVLTVLFFALCILFLMHQNGKSIYDKGI